MANEQNLRPPFQSGSEAREFGRKGGINSGKARRDKATIASTMRSMLYKPVTDEGQLKIIKKSGIPVPKNPKYVDFLVASAILRAIKKGEIDDLMKIMQIVGEEPLQSDSNSLNIAKDILSEIDSAIE